MASQPGKRFSNSHISVVLPVFDDKPLTAMIVGLEISVLVIFERSWIKARQGRNIYSSRSSIELLGSFRSGTKTGNLSLLKELMIHVPLVTINISLLSELQCLATRSIQ